MRRVLVPYLDSHLEDRVFYLVARLGRQRDVLTCELSQRFKKNERLRQACVGAAVHEAVELPRGIGSAGSAARDRQRGIGSAGSAARDPIR